MLDPPITRDTSCLKTETGHAIGKTRAAVEKQLNARTVVHGFQEDERDATEFASYPGMTIHYSADGIVLRVESNNR